MDRRVPGLPVRALPGAAAAGHRGPVVGRQRPVLDQLRQAVWLSRDQLHGRPRCRTAHRRLVSLHALPAARRDHLRDTRQARRGLHRHLPDLRAPVLGRCDGPAVPLRAKHVGGDDRAAGDRAMAGQPPVVALRRQHPPGADLPAHDVPRVVGARARDRDEAAPVLCRGDRGRLRLLPDLVRRMDLLPGRGAFHRVGKGGESVFARQPALRRALCCRLCGRVRVEVALRDRCDRVGWVRRGPAPAVRRAYRLRVRSGPGLRGADDDPQDHTGVLAARVDRDRRARRGARARADACQYPRWILAGSSSAHCCSGTCSPSSRRRRCCPRR